MKENAEKMGLPLFFVLFSDICTKIFILGSLLQPFEINIKGKTHEFEPPNIEYIDPLIKRFDIPPFEHLEMEWVYLLTTIYICVQTLSTVYILHAQI